MPGHKRRLTLPEGSGAGEQELSRPCKRWRTVVLAINQERSLRDFINSREIGTFSFRNMLTVHLVSLVRTVVSEEFKEVLQILNPVHRPIPIQRNNPRIRLKFLSEVDHTVYTSPFEVQGKNPNKHDTGLHVAIHSDNDIITQGPLSSVKIEVVVLDGDFCKNDGEINWSEEDFHKSIVLRRDNKPPLLMENRILKLKEGRGCIDWLVFGDNSSRTRSKTFRLGIRVFDWKGEPVRSGISEPFKVLDRRMEGQRKHHPPFLSDPIWRLEEIAKDGIRCKTLESRGIITVKDLLICYFTDEPGLRTILDMSETNKTWTIIVKHAKECEFGAPNLMNPSPQARDDTNEPTLTHQTVSLYDGPTTQYQQFEQGTTQYPRMDYNVLATNDSLTRNSTYLHGSVSSQQNPLENEIIYPGNSAGDIIGELIPRQQFHPGFDETNDVNYLIEYGTLLCDPSKGPPIPSRMNSFDVAECDDLLRRFLISSNLQNIIYDEIARSSGPSSPRNWLKIKALVRLIGKPLVSTSARSLRVVHRTTSV